MSKILSTKSIWHIIIGGTVGNVTEWYNFLLYGFLAPIISQLFFPSHNKLLSLTLTFVVFAMSFLMRPLGGILSGWIGDVYGRKRALVISLLMMGIPTLLIGCLPTYASIGIASPILLCVFRILQGLSAGGEHTGSAVYVAEFAPPAHRTLWISTVPTSAALGVLISSAASLLIVASFTNEQLLTWGWRVGYWAGTLLCIISLVLRLTLPETPDFQKMKRMKKKSDPTYPIIDLIHHTRLFINLIRVFFLASCWGVFYQVLFVWMPTFLTDIRHFSHSTALQINSIYLFVFSCLILCVGYCADDVGCRILLVSSCVALFILSYPLFMLLSVGKLWQIYLAMGVFTFLFSFYIPTAFAIMTELFSVQIRYTALSLGFNIGLALYGGTCPLIVTWLIKITHNTSSPAWYMMLSVIFALVACIYLPDKKGQVI